MGVAGETSMEQPSPLGKSTCTFMAPSKSSPVFKLNRKLSSSSCTLERPSDSLFEGIQFERRHILGRKHGKHDPWVLNHALSEDTASIYETLTSTLLLEQKLNHHQQFIGQAFPVAS